jgi:DNA-binding NarL/FixJ family response regulator
VAVRVAVVDPLPMFRHGVAAVLSAAGHRVDTPADLLRWAARRSSALVLLTLVGEVEWRLLVRLCEGPGRAPAVVALTDGGTAMLGMRAIQAGARSVVPRGAPAALLRRTVEATIDGQSVMPTAVTSLLISASGADRSRAAATGASWLTQLASGMTVAQLAVRTGYSERAMFRLLKSLYQEMGVTTRVEAIMRAREWGWL